VTVHDASVVDEDIDGAQLIFRLLYQPGRVGAVHNIRHNWQHTCVSGLRQRLSKSASLHNSKFAQQ
jgi:hypothetical protein